MHPEKELLDHMVVLFLILWGAPTLFSGLSGEEFTCDAEDTGDKGSIPESRRCPGVGNGNPLHYSCLENSMGSGACGLQFMGSQRVGHDWAHEQIPNTREPLYQ